MLEKIPEGFQNLHFDTLTLSPIQTNWVKRWSKARTISFIRPMMWVSSIRDENTQLKAHAMVSKMFDNGPK
jgi:hypothetical protein